MLSSKSTQLASWILYLFVLAVCAQSGCNHDDCYNALFPCESPGAVVEALDYCSTVGRYGATNYPARATAACGNTNKRAYMSACACNVACPSLLSSTESCTSTSTGSTLTTSIRASGNALPSSESLNSVTSTGSSSTLTSVGSPVSTNTGSGASGSSTLPATTTISSDATDPSSQDPASNTGTMSSDPGSSTSVSAATSTASTTSVPTSQDPVSASSNISDTSSSTRSWLSGGPSSISQSTFTSNTTGTATISLSSMLSSSIHWTNTSSTSGAPTSLGDHGTLLSTLLDPSSTLDPSSASTASSANSVSTTPSTTSSETPSTFPAEPPTFTSTSRITRSASSPSLDTTCTPTPSHSSFYHYLNSTTSHSGVIIPSATGGVFSIMPISLNRTRTRTRTYAPGSATGGSSSSMTATTTSAATSACTAAASDESIENGDFEQGLSPWSVDLVDVMSTHYGTAQPGAEGSCNAFNVRMRRNSQSDDLRSNLRLVSPMVSAPPSSRWNVSFWVRWATGDEDSYLNLYANYAVAHRVDATSSNWTRVEFPYTTGEDRNLQFVFSFVLGAAPANEVWIDKVAMSVVGAATSTGPVLAAATVTSNSVES
ncbi:hypothetical protein F4820DRAFT_452691 [Hypoxylon rubiginosum]|uniref:Uncharacterized protein n=1 Tax=Hypoxylon rubiginosum TaxID=110542 RepID=A0ACB9YNG2_9PEZI|nr:hypothetical protein F4820DRAFT_452691 [Hypoxylon rubiginosum]